jgi:ABC-type Fe3+-hydroxamate transport system substrate-binding protein
MTESLFDLGFGDSVVGITDHCVFPEGELGRLPRIGEPKTPNVEEILRLKPDLVIANREENSQEVVEEIQQASIPVWMTFPHCVQDAMQDLWTLVGYYASEQAGLKLNMLERILDWARVASVDLDPKRYFCPIWKDVEYDTNPAWWMTFNGDTYPDDLLSIMGGVNIFAQQKRLYPLKADLGYLPMEPAGHRDVRYPRVTINEIQNMQVDWILLPSEPLSYSEEGIDYMYQQFKDTPGIQKEHIRVVDGTLLFWPGTRLERALTELGDLFIS